jgi:dTDP-4-amino-4,6-dideoxygalactose transaminase
VRQDWGVPLKAVVVVHLYGHPADMRRILEIAALHGLWVIEDCAQAHGSSICGQKTGSWGHIAAFSFYPTKNLGALGDGGAVVTNDPDLADYARLLREYGWRERHISECVGMNTRLDELQAAILRIKLRYLDLENAKRRELATVYNACLADTALVLPRCSAEAAHACHQYVVRSTQRDRLREWLQAHSVGTLIHYPRAVHQQPAYSGRVLHGALDKTEQVAREILSLPIYPELPPAHATEVARLAAEYLAGAGH